MSEGSGLDESGEEGGRRLRNLLGGFLGLGGGGSFLFRVGAGGGTLSSSASDSEAEESEVSALNDPTKKSKQIAKLG